MATKRTAVSKPLKTTKAPRKVKPPVATTPSHADFDIETDIPMPVTMRYPFSSMEVGASFAFDAAAVKTVRTAAYRWGRLHGVKFTIRTVGLDIARCWRAS